MTVLLLITGLLLALLIALLLTPLVIYINTRTNEYYLNIRGIARLSPHYHDNQLLLTIKVPLYSFQVPFKGSSQKQKTTTQSKVWKKKKTGYKLTFTQVLKLVKRLKRSFRVRKLNLNLDTDDYPLNAQLIPLFSLVNTKVTRLNTNFQGINSCELLLTSRPIKAVWPIIQCFVFKN